MLHLRVYEEAEKAIQDHKWLESEKAGRDLGVDVEREWISTHWRTYCCSRLVQHMRGDAFFDEYGAESFGIFSQSCDEPLALLDAVLEKIQQGAENLDLLCWGHQKHLPTNHLLNVLIAADINGHRLQPPLR